MSSAKKLRSAVCLLLTLVLTLTMFTFPASVSALGLSKTSITLTKGYATTLTVTGANGASVSWSSSDKTVASVSSAGKVIGKSAGTATIYANVNGTKLSCSVKVVGGKLAVSSKKVTLDEGESKYITVRAKGSHGLKVVAGDKSIVGTSWVKPWKKDDIRLKLTGKASGSTTVKIYLTKYPEVYTTINVTVGDGNAVLLTSQSSVSTKIDTTASLVIYSDKDKAVNYTLSDKTVASVTEGTWKDHYCTLTIKGLKSGTTTLTLTRKDNTSVKKTVYITVSGSGYYTISTTQPAKLASTDTIYKWTDPNTKVTKYMLLPYGYDAAKVNTLVAQDSGVYSYYVVYDASPKQKAYGDTVKSFNTTVNSATAVRYVLVPQNYDVPSYNTAVANYTKKFEYWTIYNTSPENYKLLYTDIVKSWTRNLNGVQTTRYVLLPMNYSEVRLNELIASDSGSSADGYYTVSTTQPAFKVSTDQVITFQAMVNNNYVTLFILVPQNYDEARVNDAIATYTGKFEYWKVYTIAPKKQLAYDVIQTWTKVVDSQTTTRYMLLPTGYDEALFQQYKSQDLSTSSSAYYTVSTAYPTLLASTDQVWMWYNKKQNVTKYMLLPANFDVLKRNEIIYKDTGVFDYYTIYSTVPTKQLDTDQVLVASYNGGTVYMLVPQNYDQDKVNKGLAGLYVS